jgi:hypothetical protein
VRQASGQKSRDPIPFVFILHPGLRFCSNYKMGVSAMSSNRHPSTPPVVGASCNKSRLVSCAGRRFGIDALPRRRPCLTCLTSRWEEIALADSAVSSIDQTIHQTSDKYDENRAASLSIIQRMMKSLFLQFQKTMLLSCFVLFVLSVSGSCNAFVVPTLVAVGRTTTSPVVANAASSIDFQADESQFGRGDYHLSAAVDEGDVVVYQTGSWLVDGVQVGDGSPADWKLARLETIQLVWTHNCEHGVLRGMAVKLLDDGKTIQYDDGNDDEMMVEFGPEQLVARLPVVWDDSVDQGVSENEAQLDPSLWRQEEEDLV